MEDIEKSSDYHKKDLKKDETGASKDTLPTQEGAKSEVLDEKQKGFSSEIPKFILKGDDQVKAKDDKNDPDSKIKLEIVVSNSQQKLISQLKKSIWRDLESKHEVEIVSSFEPTNLKQATDVVVDATKIEKNIKELFVASFFGTPEENSKALLTYQKSLLELSRAEKK